jgi:hypothetical protein
LALWEKGATADLMQMLIVFSRLLLQSTNNSISWASEDLQKLHNYSEQPASKTTRITSTAEHYSMRQTSQFTVCGAGFGI